MNYILELSWYKHHLLQLASCGPSGAMATSIYMELESVEPVELGSRPRAKSSAWKYFGFKPGALHINPAMIVPDKAGT